MSLSASTIKSVTADGCDAKDACPAGSSTSLRGFIRPAIMRSLSGWIIRSSLETWYQLGLTFHAGAVTASPKVLANGAFWVTAMISESLTSRS